MIATQLSNTSHRLVTPVARSGEAVKTQKEDLWSAFA
jgi:hypothetical protein